MVYWGRMFSHRITPHLQRAADKNGAAKGDNLMNETEKSPLIREGGAYDIARSLYDPGSFVELHSYAGKSAYAGVVCGYGSVNGSLVFTFVQDFTRAKGAIGEDEAKKISSLYDMAIKSGAPVIGVFEGNGGKVAEGSLVLSAFGKVLSKISEASGVIPQIAVIGGVCAGISAIAASMFDLIIASKDASYFITPPSLVKDDNSKEAGKIITAARAGEIDIICDDRQSAIQKAKELFTILPQNCAQGLAYSETSDESERPTPELEGEGDAMRVIDILTDSSSFVELKGECAKEVITGLGSMGTITTGIIATRGDKYLTPTAARKISAFISFCDNFMIPTLTIVDTLGIDHTASAEYSSYSSELARLALAYSSSGNAKVTLINGKAYGAAFTLLGSKALGADVVYASPKAEVAVMEPETAAEFLHSDEIKSSPDPVTARREFVRACREETLSAKGAAKNGDIDDIVDYELLRAKIISAFMMLWSKADGKVLGKHSKLPF